MMVAVNFSKKKKKMRLGENLSKEEIRAQVPDPLTRRELLSWAQLLGYTVPSALRLPSNRREPSW